MKPEASDKKCESVQIILYTAYGKLCLHMCIFTYIDMHDHMHMDCPGNTVLPSVSLSIVTQCKGYTLGQRYLQRQLTSLFL